MADVLNWSQQPEQEFGRVEPQTGARSLSAGRINRSRFTRLNSLARSASAGLSKRTVLVDVIAKK